MYYFTILQDWFIIITFNSSCFSLSFLFWLHDKWNGKGSYFCFMVSGFFSIAWILVDICILQLAHFWPHPLPFLDDSYTYFLCIPTGNVFACLTLIFQYLLVLYLPILEVNHVDLAGKVRNRVHVVRLHKI